MMTIDRRDFLKYLSALGLCSAMPQAVFAKTSSPNIIIWITLRGAMDGLNVVVPYGDKNYLPIRKNIGIKEDEINKLDDFFGLHPALKNGYAWYMQGEMAFIHACATPYRQRSHFDGQKVLENGTVDPLNKDGWLNRVLKIDKQASSIAIDSGLPLILQGEVPSSSWYPHKLKIKEQQATLLEEMYQADSALAMNFEEAMRIEKIADQKSPSKQFKALAKQAGSFCTSPNGPNIAVLELGGWDTHAGQGGISGRLANQLKTLDTGLATLKTELGDAWSRTVIVAASEFGRTAAENGTKGTDHGTANALMLAGGAVKGRRVISQWPGLAPENLFQGRDLLPTIDMRSVIKGVLNQHIGISQNNLAMVFPDSESVPMTADLIKT
ncbi:DUF1501 domain-containing protein [Photobacterium sagamiensis]|uniref:DUF1501 domain-containing protein n=1 Tax=Photobacterium sagamiensis TaxID=2910241 RepID=UPI003D0AD39D